LITQIPGVPEPQTPAQPRLQYTPYFLLLLIAAGLLIGALMSAGCLAFKPGTQPWQAFLLCLFLTSLGFLTMLLIFQHQQRCVKTLETIIVTCQKVLGGEDTQRVSIPEKDRVQNIKSMVDSINQLLDGYTYLQKDVQMRRQELAHLQDQMELLIYEMRPVIDGDLRARSTVAGNTPGYLATMCNALVEDTAQLVQWTQYMSNQIIQTSHGLMEQSLEIAQVMETFATEHRATTRTIEVLLAFTLQMESALFSNIEMLREHQMHLHEPEQAMVPLGGQSAEARARALSDLFQDIPQQIKLLENLSQKTRETTIFAENTLKELYDVGQRFHRINGIVMQFASLVSALTTLADSWRQAAENYILPNSTEGHERLVETISTPTRS
jgi:hypothetical protein